MFRFLLIAVLMTLLPLFSGCGGDAESDVAKDPAETDSQAADKDGKAPDEAKQRRHMLQIGLAMQMHHDTFKRFPPHPVFRGDTGKPQLS